MSAIWAALVTGGTAVAITWLFVWLEARRAKHPPLSPLLPMLPMPMGVPGQLVEHQVHGGPAREPGVNGYGSIMVGGRHIPVTTMDLRDGFFVLTAELSGPCPELTGCPVLFGADGKGIGQAENEITLHELPAGGQGVLQFRMKITELKGGDIG